jgi:N-acetylmuramoyl-L-alanine amidase
VSTATARRGGRRLAWGLFVLIILIGGVAIWWYARSTHTTARWADGACRAFAPTAGNRHSTIFLDPGHGDPDPGTQGATSRGKRVYEKDLTLATAQRLMAILRADGYRVVLSRTYDGSVARLAAADTPNGVFSVDGDHKDLLARIACANSVHADLLVSLHFNGFDDPAVGGVETFYDDARPFSAQNLALAQSVQDGLLARFKAADLVIPDRGIAPDSSDDEPTLSAAAAAYPHLLLLGPAQPGYLERPSTMPGVLVEPLFLTDPAEADVAASAAGQDAIARGIAQGISAYEQDRAQ